MFIFMTASRLLPLDLASFDRKLGQFVGLNKILRGVTVARTTQ